MEKDLEIFRLKVLGELAAISDIASFLLAEATHRHNDPTLLDAMHEFLTRNACQVAARALPTGGEQEAAQICATALVDRLDKLFIDAKSHLAAINGRTR